MRVVVVAQEDMSPFAMECIKQLVAILLVVCKNPSNPSFNHYLFETIAAVIKNISVKNPEATSSFEQQLFEPFQWILVNDVQGTKDL
jgi:exportin-2 (importin alpha re-exporter)